VSKQAVLLRAKECTSQDLGLGHVSSVGPNKRAEGREQGDKGLGTRDDAVHCGLSEQATEEVAVAVAGATNDRRQCPMFPLFRISDLPLICVTFAPNPRGHTHPLCL